MSLHLGGDLKDLDHCLLMGILNLTPDSFYDGGKHQSDSSILHQTEKMLNEGAEIIDIGAFSSRPGAKLISEQDEEARLLKALESLRSEFKDCIISIDTYRKGIAEKAVDLGANMINDISAGDFDPALPKYLAKTNIPYIIMHMQGKPENMQVNPKYTNVSKEVYQSLSEKILKFRQMGISDLIIDPGFGFGKSLEHNYQLLKDLSQFTHLDCPVLVGLSRKGMIQKVIDEKAENSLNGTTAANVIALLNGANILRVHDIKAAKEAIQIVDFYQKN